MRINLKQNPFKRRKKNPWAWRVIGGAALAAAGVGLARLIPNLKR